jgi:DNA repair exonuclease SbcCD ATPase subunit
MSQKLALLRRLNSARSKALHLELELASHEEDATAVTKAKQKLDEQIEALRKQLHDDWRGKAAQVETDLAGAVSKLQAAIRDVEKDVDRAQKVVKAVGFIDEMVDKAKGLLAGKVP